MGKSFNDDVFNNDFNLESINGLNISKEAIEENKKPKLDIDISNINIDEYKEKAKKQKKENKAKNLDINKYMQAKETTEQLANAITQDDATQYIKKTMIFKKEYLDIIDGLASINDMQIKDVLNQLLEKSINQLDEQTRLKALKTGKKVKPVNTTKTLF